MIQNDNMDNVFREAADSYELTPASNAWQRLRRQLLWRKLRLVIGGGVFAAAVVVIFLFVFSEEEKELVVNSTTNQTEATISSNVSTKREEQQMESDPRSETYIADKNIAEITNTEMEVISQVTGTYVSMASEDPNIRGGHNSIRENIYFSRMETVPAHLGNTELYLNPVIRSEGVIVNNSGQMASDSACLWSVEVYSGINFSRFSAISGGLPGHQELRDEGSWILTPSLGAELKIKNNGWFFTAGLSRSRVGQKVNFDVETTELNSLLSHYDYDTTWVYIYDPPYYGEPFPASIDSTFVAVYNRQKYRGTLAIDYLTVPLIAGYELNREEISLSCGAGLAFSFPISWHGEAPNGVLNRLVPASNELSHKMDLSLLFRLEASARIAPGYWVFFRPVIGIGLLNHTGQQSGLNYRNNSAGLDVGISIDFNP